jgi:hypothetical protein
MQLHILSKNTEGKLLEGIKASQIQEVKDPRSFEELHQVLSFYSVITSILFGTGSALIVGVKLFASAILTKKIIFKGCIAADSNLPTKFLYAMEIQIQRWLGECEKFEDHLMVNNRLVSFDKVFEMVMNYSLNVTLPPNSIKSPPKNPTTTTPTTPPGDNDKQRGGEMKRKRNNNDDKDCIIKNTAPITKFLMKEDKIWKQDFTGKCSRDHPKWNNFGAFMCARWWIRGKCFCDCNNKASHIGASAVPQVKHDKFSTYISNLLGLTPQAGIVQCPARQQAAQTTYQHTPDDNPTLSIDHLPQRSPTPRHPL